MAILSVTTFPDPVFPKRLAFELDLPARGRLRLLYSTLAQLNATTRVYTGAWVEGDQTYYIFSDHAAFLYKRKGQIVLHTDDSISWNGKKYTLVNPGRLKCYAADEIDCKIIREQTELVKKHGRQPVLALDDEDE